MSCCHVHYSLALKVMSSISILKIVSIKLLIRVRLLEIKVVGPCDGGICPRHRPLNLLTKSTTCDGIETSCFNFIVHIPM